MDQESPEQKMQRLGKTPIFKLLLSQSGPNVISLLSMSLYQIIVSIFIGHYAGEIGLAAQSIYSPVEYLACTSLPTAFSIGAVSLIGPALGENNINQANIYLTQYLYWSLTFCVLFPICLLPFLRQFVIALGAKSDIIIEYSYQYAFLMTLLGPLIYTPNGGFLPLFRCENRATTAMYVQLISSLLCLIFALIFFPLLGEKLHLVPAAMSTLFALFVTAIYTVLNYTGCFRKSVLRFKSRIRPDLKNIGTIIIQSFPQFLNALPHQLGIMICNVQIAKYATSVEQQKQLSASVGLFSKLGFLVMQPRQAVYLGFVSILGFNLGARSYKRVV